MEQLGVLTAKSHQLIVRTVLHHPPMIKNIDSVGGPHCGEPVRNDQGTRNDSGSSARGRGSGTDHGDGRTNRELHPGNRIGDRRR